MALKAPPLTVDYAIVDIDNALDNLRYFRQTLMHIKRDEELPQSLRPSLNQAVRWFLMFDSEMRDAVDSKTFKPRFPQVQEISGDPICGHCGKDPLRGHAPYDFPPHSVTHNFPPSELDRAFVQRQPAAPGGGRKQPAAPQVAAV